MYAHLTDDNTVNLGTSGFQETPYIQIHMSKYTWVN